MAAGGAASDPNFASVQALLHFDGSDASTTFTDVTGRSWSAVGNAQLDTDQSKWGGSSLLLDGSGDGISTADAAALEVGSGAFTCECWVRWNSLPTSGQEQVLFSKYKNSGDNESWGLLLQNSGGTLRLHFVASTDGATFSIIVNANWTPSAGTWYFVQFIRNGASSKFAVDGSQVGSNVDTSGTIWNADSSCPFRIGCSSNASPASSLNGWIDDARFTVGVARSIALPTAAFPNS